MYKKVMVPLDGSELAECVLPHVEGLIEGIQLTEVVFVRVVEPFRLPTSAGHGDIEYFKESESNRESSAEEYLSQVAGRLKHEETELHFEVIIGNVADSLADYAKKHNIDLIIIATHGRSGVSRWVRGSIADKVLRFSNIPVMMIRAPGTEGGI